MLGKYNIVICLILTMNFNFEQLLKQYIAKQYFLSVNHVYNIFKKIELHFIQKYKQLLSYKLKYWYVEPVSIEP